ncbi:polynucleotide adenylyltransferase [Bachmanniomyces sp. S44760]|nr:polynucleotide adenylyltransferase [Bachmanniomyces sp. S44760]
MAGQQSRQWPGVTPPISLTMPTEAELAANDALIAELKKQNNFEGLEETERRKTTLQTIQKITTEFVKHVYRVNKKPQTLIDSAGGKIFTYGSYRLGVYGPGSDIDTLVVVPREVSRDDFFKYFPTILERMAPPGAIEEMTPVSDAFVPIIKLEFSGISIDLIFACLKVQSVPLTLELKDTSLLRGLDDQDLRSVNGTRVTDEILELVPQQKTFRTALRAIKLWAQRRAVYANVMGFPGGVAWAMLVARVCQLYPQATGSVIVGKFFRIISKWSWPQPVVLKNIEEGPLQVRVWNPKIYNGDRFHLMPIITPAYPSMCATHNITMSTKKIITRELMRGGDIVDKIFTGQSRWHDLFAKHTFFTQGYKYYLSIIAASRTKEAQLVWSGLVESKVRHLVTDLEHEATIELAHPFNKGFDRMHVCKDEEQIEAVISGDLQYQAPNTKTETTDSANDAKHKAIAEGDANNMQMPTGNGNTETTVNGEEKHMIYTTTYYIGIELVQGPNKKLDISWQTKNFKDTCIGWANYNAELNSLNIIHTRNYDLPADVFTSDEARPARPKKKVLKKVENGTKKRNFDASELDVCIPFPAAKGAKVFEEKRDF